MRDAFIRALTRSAEADQDVFLMVGDLGYGVIEDFETRFPAQFLNAGVAEQNMAGMAAGLASQGFKPFIYSIANFPTFRCLEQIRNDIAHANLPVVIVSVGAGFSYGNLGYSHYALEDLAIMRALPGMRVLSPSDSHEVEFCMNLIRRDPRPTYLRLGKNGEPTLHGRSYGETQTSSILRSGKTVAILTTGSISKAVESALISIDPNQEHFYLVTVPQVKPLNVDFDVLRDFKLWVTVEEHSIVGGLGSAVLERANELSIHVRTVMFGVPDQVLHEQGSTEYMRMRAELSQQDLERRLLDLLKEIR
jgi:transketolase